MRQTDPLNNLLVIDDAALRHWPLPIPSSDADKEERGRVLLIGGSREIPGAILLAANAALHAGAGKLAIAAGASFAPQLAIAVPEARVIALPETAAGDIMACAAQSLESVLGRIDTVLIGPGMQDEPAACQLIEALLPKLGHAQVILDACAMGIVNDTGNDSPGTLSGMPDSGRVDATGSSPNFLGRFKARVLLTPHAGEMAHLTGISKEDILADPAAAALDGARRWNAIVALKGGITHIAAPDGRLWRHDGGNIGLAVSGSGDTLAGIIAGLGARGAALEQACAWGVALHARAGERLAERQGQLGYLARDLSAEVPILMQSLADPVR